MDIKKAPNSRLAPCVDSFSIFGDEPEREKQGRLDRGDQEGQDEACPIEEHIFHIRMIVRQI